MTGLHWNDQSCVQLNTKIVSTASNVLYSTCVLPALFLLQCCLGSDPVEEQTTTTETNKK